MGYLVLVVCVLVVSFLSVGKFVDGIGANWGTQASHQLPPDKVVKMLRENGIQKVKLFDADYGALRALRNTGIEVMVGIPNEMLATLASSPKAAEKWVSKNVTAHMGGSGANIRLASIYSVKFVVNYVLYRYMIS